MIKFNKTASLLSLLLVTLTLLATSCKKDDDMGDPKEDTTFIFSCNINGKAWSSQNVQNPLINSYFNLDSLPLATVRDDSLLLGASALVDGYASTLILLCKPSTMADVRGTYAFTSDIAFLPAGSGMGVFDGSNTDILTYIAGLNDLEYAPGSQLIITKHSNDKLSGEFNFKIVKKSDQTVFYEVQDGKFQNLPIK